MSFSFTPVAAQTQQPFRYAHIHDGTQSLKDVQSQQKQKYVRTSIINPENTFSWKIRILAEMTFLSLETKFSIEKHIVYFFFTIDFSFKTFLLQCLTYIFLVKPQFHFLYHTIIPQLT